jgi:hypothetical protein
VFNLTGLFVRTVLCHASLIAFYYVLYAIEMAQANLAVIASLFALAAFFTAFVFKVVFDE